jgi:hypothetical protein
MTGRTGFQDAAAKFLENVENVLRKPQKAGPARENVRISAAFFVYAVPCDAGRLFFFAQPSRHQRDCNLPGGG